MASANKEYAKLLAEQVQQKTGFYSETAWTQCSRSNSTYKDCPVSSKEDEYKMQVIVHNPSTIDLSEFKIAVPDGKFSVQAFDMKEEKFVDVGASVTCYQDFGEDLAAFKSCWLYGAWSTKAHDTSLIELTHSKYTMDLEQQFKVIKAYDQIHSENIHL